MDLSNLVGDALKSDHQRLLDELKKASAANADETGFRVDGVNHWCWVFVWEGGIVYVIHPSRGQTCPKEVLGEDFKGVLGRDGWLY